jgi:hypothetical protein
LEPELPTITEILEDVADGTTPVDVAEERILAATANRDAFAAAALQGKLAAAYRPASEEALAKECYAFADAMCAVRCAS